MADIKRCSFCGKPETRVENLFTAGDNHICDECVMFCYDILAKQNKGAKAPAKVKEIKKAKESGIKLVKRSLSVTMFLLVLEASF